MIRLNKFFVAKGATPPPVADAARVGPVDDDHGFAQRLRQALDRGGKDADRGLPLAADRSDAEFDLAPSSGDDGADALSSDLDLSRSVASPPPRAVIPPQQRLAAAVVPAPPRKAEPIPAQPSTATVGQVDLSQLSVPAADAGAGRRAGRVRTRLLGYDPVQSLTADPIEVARAQTATERELFPVGWIIVTRGPGRGSFFALFNGVSQIGRGEDQAIKLDFGDSSISRSNHAAIAYDHESNGFYLGHGGKANIVRLNDRPVISTESLNDHDVIRIGETTLLFVALCSDEFRWTREDEGTDEIG